MRETNENTVVRVDASYSRQAPKRDTANSTTIRVCADPSTVLFFKNQHFQLPHAAACSRVAPVMTFKTAREQKAMYKWNICTSLCSLFQIKARTQTIVSQESRFGESKTPMFDRGFGAQVVFRRGPSLPIRDAQKIPKGLKASAGAAQSKPPAVPT